MGIGCLRALRERGHEVTVFEQLDDVGGTWHPHNNYSGLRIHAPAATIEYPEFPLPANVDKNERIKGFQVYDYFRRYSREQKFYDHIRLNQSVTRIFFDSSNNTSALSVTDAEGRTRREGPFDFVIHTHGYVDRVIPSIKGLESFRGEVLHAFDVKDDVVRGIVTGDKRVVVIGGSKSAADCVLNLFHPGIRARWVYRRPYWFIRSRLEAPSKPVAWVQQLVRPRMLLWSRRHPWLALAASRACGDLATYGRRHWDYRRFHMGALDDGELMVLRRYAKQNGIEGEIGSVEENHVVLTTPEPRRIPADVLIFCTGVRGSPALSIPIEVDGELFELAAVRTVYLKRVVPEIPNLIFTCLHNFGLGVTNGMTYGAWVARYVEHPPTRRDLEARSKTYAYPFLREQALFSSDRYLGQMIAEGYEQLVREGEVSPAEMKRWVTRASPGPLTFLPRAESPDTTHDGESPEHDHAAVRRDEREA